MLTQRKVLSAMLTGLEEETVDGVLTMRGGLSRREAARPLPERDLWFERVWQKFREVAP